MVRVHVRQPNVKEQGKPVNFHSDRPILAENPIKNRPINARTNKLPGEKAALHQLPCFQAVLTPRRIYSHESLSQIGKLHRLSLVNTLFTIVADPRAANEI